MVLVGAAGRAVRGRDVAEVVADEARVRVVVDLDGRRRHLTLVARFLARRLLKRPLRPRIMPAIQSNQTRSKSSIKSNDPSIR